MHFLFTLSREIRIKIKIILKKLTNLNKNLSKMMLKCEKMRKVLTNTITTNLQTK